MKESFDWILACIKSCKNLFHLDSCIILVQLFNMKFGEESGFVKYHGMLLHELNERKTFLSPDI